MSPCSWLRQNFKILLSQFHSPSLIPCDNLFPISSDSSSLFFFTLSGGDDGIRTHDPLLAGQVLSQLSYTPIGVTLVSRVVQFLSKTILFDSP